MIVAGMLVIGLIGFCADSVLRGLQKWLVTWQ
jgi:ABC-type nitrate/sulfonate/bicarbonate transport system permease component